MKKFLIIIAFILIYTGCKQLDRVNPTDPKSSNYIGITYKGAFGSFANLTDIAVKDNYIFCIDSVNEDCNKYRADGTLDFGWSGAFTNPTGICADENYIYILNKTPTNRVLVFDATDTSTVLSPKYQFLVNQGYKIAVSGSYFYVASSFTANVYKYDKTNGNFISDFAITTGNCSSCLEQISAIEIHSSGAILVADPILKKIVAFDTTGNFIKAINLDIDIFGFVVKENTLIIPTTSGVYEISYESGEKIKVWGNYGEGNGKITQPSLIDCMGDKIFIGNSTQIKIFAP